METIQIVAEIFNMDARSPLKLRHFFYSKSGGNDLATEKCPFLAFYCLFPLPKNKEKALQNIDFVGLVFLLSPFGFDFKRYGRDSNPRPPA